ncbi:UDP-N-acetylglucosamine transferase subunit ALG14 homolog [Osmia bicornis bicornis]|uniref:UDP-N-acetylglucosamine transferase subunit ALG14 homolog n=1 Tax=Osmia bicornis bicornis TaxID=1437191 RepID=UPI0010FA090B|nr:UDP-N-acetylglucosamine transferase subunit ALG14 homolog [Osmia bicornis bicornis]
MYIMYSVYIFILICSAIIARICFMRLFTYKTEQRKVACIKPVKTMIILGSGGHTAEMIRIFKYLDFKNYTPRIYVYADTDIMSMEKIKSLEKNNVDYKAYKIRRSREIHQSYYTSVYTTIYAILESVPILWKERPELILCNGPGTCVPLCITAFLFKVFYIMQTTMIFIESFCRVKTLSLTGKILYSIVDHQIVQWPYLCKPDNNGRTFYL